MCLSDIINEWKQKIVWTSRILQQDEFDYSLKSRFLMLMNAMHCIVILTLAPVLTHTQLIIWLIVVFRHCKYQIFYQCNGFRNFEEIRIWLQFTLLKYANMMIDKCYIFYRFFSLQKMAKSYFLSWFYFLFDCNLWSPSLFGSE